MTNCQDEDGLILPAGLRLSKGHEEVEFPRAPELAPQLGGIVDSKHHQGGNLYSTFDCCSHTQEANRQGKHGW